MGAGLFDSQQFMKGIEIANGSLQERQHLNCNSTNLALLATAIEVKHRCRAVHLETVRVTKQAEGEMVWDGEVGVFALIGHESAKRCYGWVEFANGSQRQYTTVLQRGPVDSPEAAVRTWLASEHVTIEPVTVAPHWHGQYFLNVGTISDV